MHEEEDVVSVEDVGDALVPKSSPPSSPEAATAGDLVQGRYLLQKKVGAGAFGCVFSALDIQTNEEVAVKVEKKRALRQQQLANEYRVYQVMQGGTGINTVRSFQKGVLQNTLVMDMLGPSLEDWFNHCGRKFSIKTILMLADQMISLLEWFHVNNYVHRDIKPENFAMGLGHKGMGDRVFIIDFGLAKRYRNNQGVHLPLATTNTMTGTLRYLSLNTHRGFVPSRRDDMEALGFVLLYFARGNLPWQGVDANNKAEKYKKVTEMKKRITLDDLAEGLPEEFKRYMVYCRQLTYEEVPDYGYLRLIFSRLLEKVDQSDCRFDWLQIRVDKIGVRRDRQGVAFRKPLLEKVKREATI